MVWYFHLLNFPQFIAIHIAKGFGVINKPEVDVFLNLSCLSNDLMDVGNLISGSSAFCPVTKTQFPLVIYLPCNVRDHLLQRCVKDSM